MRIVEERDNYALVEEAGRWTVVERRAGKYYPLKDGARDGAAPDRLQELAGLDWLDELGARRRIVEVDERRKDLAERLW